VENQRLIALEYWREYRTQFHIGVSWELHETTVDRIINKVEKLLVNSGRFKLPSRRQLYQPGRKHQAMMLAEKETQSEEPESGNRDLNVLDEAASPQLLTDARQIYGRPLTESP